ncbi:MAG: hypothetical protein ACOY4T_09430 [Pseudomonadota bacterium]
MKAIRCGLALIAGTAAILSAGVAGAKTYFCTYSGAAVANNALPDKVEIKIDGNGNAFVLDPFILGDKGGPIPAKLRTASQNRLLVTRSLDIFYDGSTLRVDFRLWVPPEGGASSMTADILRYDGKQNSKGQCKITKA